MLLTQAAPLADIHHSWEINRPISAPAYPLPDKDHLIEIKDLSP
jgi:hypothetical protein